MTSPVPGFESPSPRTWAKGDFITTPRLRGDMTNLAYLFAGGARPMLLSLNASSQIPNTGSVTPLYIGNIVPLNTWNVPVIAASGPGQSFYQIPMAGWWLVQGDVTQEPVTGSQFKYSMGFSAVVNGVSVANSDGGAVPASSGSGLLAGSAGCELYQFNTYAATADTLSMYCFTDNTNPGVVFAAFLAAEWAGLPTSGLSDYTGPYGTVVSSPQAAAFFPPGPGTTITNSGGIVAGATSVTVHDATGMVTGGTLGLDYIAGQLYAPVAEAVTITGIAGDTISITATSFPHLQGAPVAVPNSAAFLNQQCRDIVNFLAYPPMLRAAPQTTQSIPSGSNTQITGLTATLDNFSGFASNEYTAPVAGTYLVYGQVYYAGSTAAFSATAGIQVNAGTIQFGTQFRSDTTSGVQGLCATVRRVLRLNLNDTVKLYGFQNSGSAMNTFASSASFSRLICVFRSF